MNQTTKKLSSQRTRQALLLSLSIVFGIGGCGATEVSGPNAPTSSKSSVQEAGGTVEAAPRMLNLAHSSEMVLAEHSGVVDLRSIMIRDENGIRSLAERTGKSSLTLSEPGEQRLFVAEQTPDQLACGTASESPSSCSMQRQISSDPTNSAVYCCYLIGCDSSRCYYRCYRCG